MLKKNYLWVALTTLYKTGWLAIIRSYLWTCTESINAILMIAVFSLVGPGFSDVYHAPRIFVIGLGLWVMAGLTRTYFGTAHGMMYYKVERVLENYVMSPLPAWLWLLSVVIDEIQSSFFSNWPVLAVLFLIGMPLPAWDGFLLGLGLLILAMVFFVCLGFLMMLTAQKWNDLSKWDNTIILPAFMLSGSFFDADAMPQQYRFLMEWNPIYQLQYGVRQLWFLNSNPIPHNYIVWGAMTAGLFCITWFVLWRGYGLKR